MIIITCLLTATLTVGSVWVILFKLIRAFGLFGFAGGMTNWLAIRMMFDKIPFLVGR